MLAARVAAVNELANLAGACNADISAVFRVVGSDPRIGSHYLQPGPGFGGSCLPKDLRALRSEEHTSELQARPQLVCRLPLDKKKPSLISMTPTLETPVTSSFRARLVLP